MTKLVNEKREFYRSLKKLVLPITLQNLLFSAVSASDAVMLGFLNQKSLSAVSLATQVAFVLGLFQMAITAGATILAAQYWGKDDTKSVERVLAISMRYALIIGVIFALGGALFPGYIMRIFTADPGMIDIGEKYIRVASASYLISSVTQVYLCIMKTCGKAVLSTVIGGSGVIINVVMNAVLIFGIGPFPKMSATGAALATVIAHSMGLLFILLVLIRRKCIALRLRYLFGHHGAIHKDFITCTLPVLGNQLAWGGGITMYSVIMGHLGNDATAANSVATIVRNLCASLCWGIATGAGILVGNKLGRNDLEGAKKDGSRLCRIALVTGVVSGLVILVLIPLITHLVQLSDVANGYLKWMLLINVYYIVGNSINSTVISGIFCAGGDTRFGMICDFINMWIVILPCAFLAAFVLNVPVLVVSVILSMDEFTKLPVIYRHYKKYKWIRNLTRENS